MERTPRTILVRTLGILFVLGIVVFGYSRFGGYLRGPSLKELSLINYETVDTLSTTVTGTASNTDRMLVNGRNVIFSDRGAFNEIIPLSPGINHIDVELTDPFGRTRSYQYTLYSTTANPHYERNYQTAHEQSLRESTIDEPPGDNV